MNIVLNPNLQDLQTSATIRINALSNQLKSQGRTIYKLGLGQSPFPVPDSVIQVLRDHAEQKDYLPVSGLPALRQSVAGYLQRTQQIEGRGAEEIIISPGTKELFFLIQLACHAELLLPAPSWVSYAPQAQILGRNVRWIQTSQDNGWHLSADDFDTACRDHPQKPRLLLLNSPCNPTGAAYSAEQIAELATVAKRYGIIVISDEIYEGVHFKNAHYSIARDYPEGTIITNGLSKWCGAGGWRLGFCSFPPQLRWLQDAVTVLASETFTSVNAPIQYAAITAFDGNPEIDAYLQYSRQVLAIIANIFVQHLEQMQARCTPAAGGFYLMPNFSRYQESFAQHGMTTSRAICERLLRDTGVAVLPGDDFGLSAEQLTLRLAFVDFDGAGALKIMHQTPANPEEQIRQHCAHLIAALDCWGDWLASYA